MSVRFRASVDRLFELEGVYSDDPTDRGGPTLFGISKRSYPDVDFSTLTKDGARAIYYRDFWRPLHLDFLTDAILARLVFLFAVNAGPERAARALQRAVNGVGTPLSIDGHIGPATLSAVNGCGYLTLRKAMLKGMENYYSSLIENDPTQKEYEHGWENRYREFREQ